MVEGQPKNMNMVPLTQLIVPLPISTYMRGSEWSEHHMPGQIGLSKQNKNIIIRF